MRGDRPRGGVRRLVLLAGTAALVARVTRHWTPVPGHPWFAAFYDGLARLAEHGELGRRRHAIVGQARGRVLELGSGTGENFKHYGVDVAEVVALEPDPYMRRRGRRRTPESSAPIHHVAAAGEQLPFRDRAFDTVVLTLVLCSIADPDAAVIEIRRVLRPGGVMLLLEHVRAESPTLARWQDRLERPWMALAAGCHPNRDTEELLARHGFNTLALERFGLRPSIPLVTPHLQGMARTAAESWSPWRSSPS